MTLIVDRRLLLKAATMGLSALALPGAAQALSGRGFTHNVASGEPGQDKVLLWTRYVPGAGGSPRLSWQVAADPDFARIVSEGEAEASEARDWCVKPVASGLAPGAWYYYRFRDAGGTFSPVGRTRTLPDGPLGRFNLAIFSCANLAFGHFNAYAHAAARGDIDLALHLGDYLYEYRRGTYPSDRERVAGRIIEPPHEAVALADYRMRYAAYRADPDLQRLHQLLPMVMMWDDHESANDAWSGGAENHQPESEGEWSVRKAAAMRAAREWLPVSDNPWEAYRIGDLAELFRLETRLTARSRQPDLAAYLRGKADIAAALREFRDGPWQDPARTMLGSEQEAWLAAALRRSTSDKVRWQLLAQQTVMGQILLPPETAGWIPPNAPEIVRQRSAIGLAAAQAGLPFNLDAWDGYPVARRRLLESAMAADAELIVLSGDSHNGWAFDLGEGGAAAGVEFAGHSVTSPGLEAYVPGVAADVVARALVAANPSLHWADTRRRGYMTLALTPDRAEAEWVFMGGVQERSAAEAGRHRMATTWGAHRLA